MISPSVNMLTGQPEKDYANKPTEKQRTKKPINNVINYILINENTCFEVKETK